MFELISLQFMRDFYNEIGFEFTDFQKATLNMKREKNKKRDIGCIERIATIYTG